MDKPRVPVEETFPLLEHGEIEVLGRLPYSSNYTFLARLRDDGHEALAVYKPTRGERPLWDFPTGTLAAREVAAYWISEEAGWGIVPPTAMRDTGPLGPGSLQAFVDHDPDRHYFALMDEHADHLRDFAAFDAVVNNADRKAGHVLEDESKRLWAVDHGVTFHVEPKLRTVIWAYADDPLPERIRATLEKLGASLDEPGGVGERVAKLLSNEEAEATLARVEGLLLEDRFPAPGGDRPLPWPLI